MGTTNMVRVGVVALVEESGAHQMVRNMLHATQCRVSPSISDVETFMGQHDLGYPDAAGSLIAKFHEKATAGSNACCFLSEPGYDGDDKIMFISIELLTDPSEYDHRALLDALNRVINDDKLHVR